MEEAWEHVSLHWQQGKFRIQYRAGYGHIWNIYICFICVYIEIIYVHEYRTLVFQPLQWHHNGLDSVSNHQTHHCLLSRLFGRWSKKTSKLRVTGLCAWNSPGTGELPAQMASYAENVSIWWRHHAKRLLKTCVVWQPSCSGLSLLSARKDNIKALYYESLSWRTISPVPELQM